MKVLAAVSFEEAAENLPPDSDAVPEPELFVGGFADIRQALSSISMHYSVPASYCTS